MDATKKKAPAVSAAGPLKANLLSRQSSARRGSGEALHGIHRHIPDLFEDPAPPYQRHSATSRRAAERIAPMAPTKRGEVLAFITACGPEGATDEEMQRRMPMPANTQRPRRIELVADGFVKSSGKTRVTRSGDYAVVWVAC
jgi:hypothetical protein